MAKLLKDLQEGDIIYNIANPQSNEYAVILVRGVDYEIGNIIVDGKLVDGYWCDYKPGDMLCFSIDTKYGEQTHSRCTTTDVNIVHSLQAKWIHHRNIVYRKK